MAVTPTWPGVYVQEVPSGVRSIVGVGTSTALFVGFTLAGPVSRPVLCTSFSDFVRTFGEDLSASDMTRQLRLFFLNGGTMAYVMRVAEGAAPSQVDLNDAALAPALRLTAAEAGTRGDLIRASVSYAGTQPEDGFTLELFRWAVQSSGALVPSEAETLRGLSMDPASTSYAPNVIDAVARLVDADALAGGTSVPATSYSMLRFQTASFDTEWGALVSTTAQRIQLSVAGSRYVEVTLPPSPTNSTDVLTDLLANINAAFIGESLPVPVGLTVDWQVNDSVQRLFIRSSAGNVFVRRAATNDAAAALRWGSEQGGIEITRYAHERPAPTGVVLPVDDFDFFEDLALEPGPTPTATLQLNRYAADGTPAITLITATWSAPPANPVDEPDRVGTILGAIRDAINAGPPLLAGESWPWAAELWGHRLAIVPRNGPVPAGLDDNRESGFAWISPGVLPLASIVANRRYYSLGVTGAGAFQAGGLSGADGTAPTSAGLYDAAYEVVSREIDLFNLLVLPRAQPPAVPLESLWAAASAFCQQERAFLLMEPPPTWSGAQQPSNDITVLRTGLSKSYAALYYPPIRVLEGRVQVDVGATGAMAGLMARIDGERGVWKAPAGIEADLRGVVGVSQRLSDAENGLLNPRGINVVRAMPAGVVSWGARTLDGDDNFASEQKYVPVRRLSLFLEESLYRGLQWVVFEPNGETLWAQIRLNVGAFMQGLYRKGAFQGTSPQQAYFVKCDAETTPPPDRDQGIVNIWVGFAPLRPAEFVMLSLQQMTGQVEV